ncbi:class I SAM-dependent methyltransferase [Natronoarchaeum rubrum]|uniref:class I SAM-dependent methyltransferase n=1 Tax=Natronoarchaeum rubrum TaxID=755311 RepID=UPI00211320BD|nr:class I SAM-dependent methyltransferase [Natronoarchaeum rubrum]
MDEVRRTLDAYESDADAYVEKYLGGSIAAQYGDAFFDELDGDRILDVGCGPGPDLETFANRGYDATGLDLSPSFLRAASDHVSDAAVARGDMRRLPFEARSFDGVWSSASLLHVPRADAASTLREFRRVLRRGGVAFVSVKRGETPGSDPNGRHFEYYRERELRELLADAELEPVNVRTDTNWVSAVVRRPDCA